jgi:hypothetical protein
MEPRVCWRLMFRVANRQALERCLARTLPLLNDDCVLGECKPYWKIPELWECSLTTPSPAHSVPEQVFACLLIAYRLATGWSILGSLSSESANGFEGVFALGNAGAKSNVVKLEWASFCLIVEG